MYIKKNVKVTETYKKFILGFVALTVVMLIVVLYFSTGKAVIKVYPKATLIKSDFIADVVTDGGSGENYLQGILFETEVYDVETGTATGVKLLPGDSIGKVTLINNRSEAQTLVKTTRLLTKDGVLLRLLNRVSVPAKGEVEADVYADNPNAFKDLAPTKFTIPGLSEALQKEIYGESSVTLTSDGKSIKVVADGDIAKVRDDLRNKLYEKAISEFKTQTNSGDEMVAVVAKVVPTEEISAKADDQVDQFTVRLTLAVTLIGLKKSEIVALAEERLKTNVPAGDELLSLSQNNFSYSVQNYNDEKKTANVKVHIEGKTVIRSDNDLFTKNDLSGFSAKAVEMVLSKDDAIESVTVELSPMWVKKVPKMKDHVEIVIIKDNIQ